MDLISQPIIIIYLILWSAWISVMIIFRNIRGLPTKRHRILSFLMLIGMLLLVILPPLEYANFSGPLPRDGILAWAGLFIFAFGIFLQYAAMQTLVRGYASGQMLVTDGIYRVVRHPGTIGHLLTMAGIGLSMSSILTLVLTILFVPLLIRWIKDEEKILIANFGREYQHYMKKTKNLLIPFIY